MKINLQIKPEWSSPLLVLALMVFFLQGLENIDLPPLEGHEWRQTLTIAVSENIHSIRDVFYPTTIIGGDNDLFASEFPVYNVLHSVANGIFGYANWYGRLINWIFSCIGLLYFYKIARAFWDQKVAFYAAVFFASSIVFEYARKTMPDTFAMSLTMMGIYLMTKYLNGSDRKNLVGGFIMCTLGGLSKIVFVLIWSFLIIPFLDKKIDKKRKGYVFAVLAIGLAIVCIWYFIWVEQLLGLGAKQLFWNFGLIEGYYLFQEHKYESIVNLVENAFHFMPLALMSIVGLGILFTDDRSSIQVFTGAYIVGTVLFAFKSGSVFPTHDYYLIPLLPLLAIGASLLVGAFKFHPILTTLLAVSLAVPGMVHNKQKSFNPFHNRYVLELPALIDSHLPKDARVSVNGDEFNPFLMFWTGRKGWTFTNEDFSKTIWIRDLNQHHGLDFLVQDKNLLKKYLEFEIVTETNDFVIYDASRVISEDAKPLMD